MKKFRKIAALGMALAMTLTAFSGSAAFAATTSDKDEAFNNGKTEKVDGKYAIISIDLDGYYKDRTSVSVPSKLNNKTISRIGDGDSSVISGGSGDKNLYLPSSIDLIADAAFEGVTNFKRITMDDGVKEIGERAFAGCSAEKYVLANTITKMGVEAFRGASITSVSLPNSLSAIPDSAFEDCSDLENVTINSNLTKIGDSAFLGCDSLDEITIPASVTRIGYDAIPEDVTIKGYKNSAAEKYARDNDLDFEVVGNSSGSGAVSLNTTSLNVAIGSSTTFSVNNPSGGFSAVSSNASVATVTGYNGSIVTITGVSAGSATITVSASGYSSASLNVTVSSNGSTTVNRLSLDASSKNFFQGENYYVLVSTDSAAQPTATSSNPGVASVVFTKKREQGDGYIFRIQGLGAGAANITVSAGGRSATMNVYVSGSTGYCVTSTTSNIGLSKNQIHEFTVAVSGTNNTPNFTVGNGSVLITQAVSRSGNIYTYRIKAVGNPGQKTGVYVTLPGQPKAVMHFETTVAYG